MIQILIMITLYMSLSGSSMFKENKTCKGCHPIIYNEYTQSAHKKSTIYNDSIHKAIWDKHPNKQKGKYGCVKCHAPTDTRILDALKNKKNINIIKNQAQTTEAISCIYCHSIKDIKKHGKRSDSNILVNNNKKRPILFAANKTKKDEKINYKTKTSFLGIIKNTTGSPYHDIDYSNKGFYTGKVCMGCHAHFENEHKISICNIDYKGAQNETQNCITCHMPKITGSATTIAISKSHTYHGFAGVKNKPNMLKKYLTIELKKYENNFKIILHNKAPHNLFIHTFRKAVLNIKINSKIIKSLTFERSIGNNGEYDFPWLAKDIIKNTMLKANETREIIVDTKLNKNDKIEVEFGYYLVDPLMNSKLKLVNDKNAVKFKLFKYKEFN